MAGIPYTSVSSYVAALRMRSARSVLLEGRTDKQILARLRGDLERRNPSMARVELDTAESIRWPDAAMGNRQKVELVCEAAHRAGLRKQAGFVDREYRGFDLDDIIRDQIQAHFVAE